MPDVFLPGARAGEPAAELRQLFAENLTKLGTLTAALGLSADAPLDDLRRELRHHVAAHARLLAAANDVLVSTQPSLGEVWVRGAAIQRLREAVEFTQKQ